MHKPILAAAVSTILVLGVACGGDNRGSGGGTELGATVRDFGIDLSTSTAPAGGVTFSITNEGPSTHEFEILKTGSAPDQLPVSSGKVETEQLEVVDEVEDIAPETSTSLSVDLDAGSYVIICNVPGHYEQGMHAAFTVE